MARYNRRDMVQLMVHQQNHGYVTRPECPYCFTDREANDNEWLSLMDDARKALKRFGFDDSDKVSKPVPPWFKRVNEHVENAFRSTRKRPRSFVDDRANRADPDEIVDVTCEECGMPGFIARKNARLRLCQPCLDLMMIRRELQPKINAYDEAVRLANRGVGERLFDLMTGDSNKEVVTSSVAVIICVVTIFWLAVLVVNVIVNGVG